MENKLIRSVFIVFAFWYVVLLLLSGDWASAPWAGLSTIEIWASGAAAAAIVVALRKIWQRSQRMGAIIRDETVRASVADLKVTIMANPKTAEFIEIAPPLPSQPARAPVNEATLNKLPINWRDYAQKFPRYAAAVRAVLEIMESKPGLPAAPVPGGHGGATLFEHSCHVLQAMTEIAPRWRYTGMTTKKGKVVVPVLDIQRGYHAFDGGAAQNPLLILAAMAHDIGKVECYRRNDGGTIDEVKPDHGRVGADMLRRVPEITVLPYAERQALLLAVGYYHAPQDLTVADWVGDMARSLTMLLYEADCLASAREGGAPPEKAAAAAAIESQINSTSTINSAGITPPSEDVGDMRADEGQALPADESTLQKFGLTDPETVDEQKPAEVAQTAAAAIDDPLAGIETFTQQSADKSDKNQNQEIVAIGNAAGDERVATDGAIDRHKTPIVQNAVANHAESDGDYSPEKDPPCWASTDGRTPYDILQELLRNPDAVNGKNAQERLGFKYGEWLYVFDHRLRSQASALAGEDLMSRPSRGQMHNFTKELLRQLEIRKLLMQDFNGSHYGYKRALWICETSDAGRESVVIVMRASVLTRDVGDAKYPPKITRNVWGDQAAQNKNRSAVDGSAQISDNRLIGKTNAKPEPQQGAETELPLLTRSGLEECAKQGRIQFIEKTIDGKEQRLFSVEDLIPLFSFNLEDLPEGVDRMYGTKSQKYYVCIPL